MVILLAIWALAAEPGEPVEPDGETVVVYGQWQIELARQKIIGDLADLGYTDVVDKGDYLVIRSPAAWQGEVIVHDDGWVRMKRQPARLRPPTVFGKSGSPASWAACALFPPGCVKLGGVLVSKQKFMWVIDDTTGAIHPDAEAYGDRVADAAIEGAVNGLPERLYALWNEGTPLREGDPVAPDRTARKAAILAYWDSRTDTVWGDRVRYGIEAFMRGEVQTGPDAWSRDEIAAFNAKRSCTRELDLWTTEITPVDEVDEVSEGQVFE